MLNGVVSQKVYYCTGKSLNELWLARKGRGISYRKCSISRKGCGLARKGVWLPLSWQERGVPIIVLNKGYY